MSGPADARLADGAGDALHVAEPEGLPLVVDHVAVARLYGEPLFQLPTDLYIPPDALEVFLETFEGPLDLLLYLIRKQNFNILDIPLADVTRQYLTYVDQIRSRNLELASEYLLMAAMLIEIKSRMLLPPKKSEEGQEAEDPRAELVRRLLEYERIKLGAARLDQLPLIGRDFLRAQVYIEQSLEPRFPEVELEDLRSAWQDILRRAKLVQHHRISREELSVREHMSMVLRTLQGRRFIEFEQLFDPRRGAQVLVVTFIAMLELARERLLEITQAEAFAPIYVRLAYQPAAARALSSDEGELVPRQDGLFEADAPALADGSHEGVFEGEAPPPSTATLDLPVTAVADRSPDPGVPDVPPSLPAGG